MVNECKRNGGRGMDEVEDSRRGATGAGEETHINFARHSMYFLRLSRYAEKRHRVRRTSNCPVIRLR